MSQIAMALNWPAEETSEAFIVTPSNEAAVRRIEAFPTWPVCAMILTGPRKSGRSLFGRIFAHSGHAAVIDDAESQDETAIFNAWNDAQRLHRPLLIIADAPPPVWAVTLPDLRSRLSATPHVEFERPDDDLAAGLVQRLLERRGLAASPALIAYLNARVERSHHAVIDIVDRLDMAALSSRRPVTVPLAREVLDGFGRVG